MSYYLTNEDGFVADFASIGGLATFRTWADEQGGIIEDFVTDGETDRPAELAGALETSPTRDAVTAHMKADLMNAAKRSRVILILTDGSEPT